MAADPIEQQADAQRFLEELGQRSGGELVLDAPWWMNLQMMLAEGWQIIPPDDDEDAEGR